MNIAILGYGTVGRGVDGIIRSSVPEVDVTRILELPDRLTNPRMTSNFDEILSDPSIELVVECMGGIEPAHEFIVRSLNAKKHVVTSNKAVVAAHFGEFAQLSEKNDVSFLVANTMSFYEQQSTFNPNMPMRFLENRVFGKWNGGAVKRGLCVALSLLFVIGVIRDLAPDVTRDESPDGHRKQNTS